MSCGRKIGPYPCCSVVEGDCLELMKAVPDGAVDAVITDPPYGIEWARGTWPDDPAFYPRLLSEITDADERIAANGSPIFVWQSATNMRKLAEWFPFEWRLFIGARNFVQMRPTHMQWAFDPVVVWWKKGAKPWTAAECSRDWFVSNNARCIGQSGNLEKGHPCPKPLDQFVFIISQWCRLGGIVFDPFLGSGTTAVAAKKLGRHFLGFEISPEYCRIARERIALVEAQPNLFEPQPEQMELPG
jgi:site-specific DNA-methyltransferase (adenine-specific)